MVAASSQNSGYDVIGFGHPMVDYVIRADISLIEGLGLVKNASNDISDKPSIEDYLITLPSERFPGGSVGNVLSGMAGLGCSALEICALGTNKGYLDSDGCFYLGENNSAGVDVNYVPIEGSTGKLYAIITEDDDRTFAANQGVSALIRASYLSHLKNLDARIFHTTLFELFFSNEACMHMIKNATGLKSFDLASHNLLTLDNKKMLTECLGHMDIVFANIEEYNATKELGIDLEDVCRIIVLKKGEEGALITHDGSRTVIEPYKVNVVETNGAGDAFAAGFLYGLCKNYPIEKSGKIGAFYASKVVGVAGARYRERISMDQYV